MKKCADCGERVWGVEGAGRCASCAKDHDDRRQSAWLHATPDQTVMGHTMSADLAEPCPVADCGLARRLTPESRALCLNLHESDPPRVTATYSPAMEPPPRKLRACISCAQKKLRMKTFGMQVSHAKCDSCGRRDLTVEANVPERLRCKEPPPPPPPPPRSSAYLSWDSSYSAGSIELGQLENGISRVMRDAFYAGWDAREKLAEEEKQQLRDEISEQADQRDGER